MASNTIADLRTHLFETLEGLRDREKPLDIERAKAVCEVAGKIIDTAKVEVAYLNSVGGKGSGFIDTDAGAKRLTGPATNGSSSRKA